jgi:hypothetical protein
MLTFSVLAFAVVLLKLLFGGTHLVVNSWTFDIAPIDAGLAIALLGPTLTAYVARKHTDANAPIMPDAEDKTQ